MKVLDLKCSHAHGFEGWFASENDFQDQLARGLVTCPMCGDASIQKKLSAPRLNLNTARGDSPAPSASSAATEVAVTPPSAPNNEVVANITADQMQAAWLQVARHVMANTEDVGRGFSEEARKMHYGEAEHRNIRGQATPQETRELLEEGIQVLPLPLPDGLKGPLQ